MRRMKPKNRLAGRFLPSRVYARWKWIVRFGLAALPLVLFLAGGLTLYFEPVRHAGTIGFEYLGDRSAAEVVGLLKSHEVAGKAGRSAGFLKDVDLETAASMVARDIEVEIEPPGSKVLQLQVTALHPDTARDLARALVQSLESHEKQLATAAAEIRIQSAERAIGDAEDEAEKKRLHLERLVSVRGVAPADVSSRLDLGRARADWEEALQNIRHHEDEIARERMKLESARWSAVHSSARAMRDPDTPGTADSMTRLILRALGIGLGFALLAPYLLELAFPRGRKTRQPQVIWSESRVPEH